MAETKNEQLKEITERLENGILSVFESDKYKEYLNTMSKFHNYSFSNTMLIAMQMPEASLVAGFNSWKNNFKRTVNKGEKGIKIFAPAPYTVTVEREKIDEITNMPILDENGDPVMEEVQRRVPSFKVVSVFDVSQTSGQELPTIGVKELDGTVEGYRQFFNALKEVSPVPINFEIVEGGAKGFFSHTDKRIVIHEGMSEQQNVKTAIHEIAHAMLHDKDLRTAEGEIPADAATKEVQAESIAYTVCQHFGIDTSDYTFAYVAGWSAGKELPELRASLEVIKSTASDLISTISERLQERDLTAERSAEAPAKETQAAAEEKTDEKPSRSGVIGNTKYSEIKDKIYIKVPLDTTDELADRLNEAGVHYSGLVGKKDATFTISSTEKEAFDKIRTGLDKEEQHRQQTETQPKQPRNHKTKEEIDRANSVNLPQFLETHGFNIKRVGRNEYTIPEHDSLRIHDNQNGEAGKWYRFSEGRGGSNIDFIREFMDKSFVEAVELLNGEVAAQHTAVRHNVAAEQPTEKPEVSIEENKDKRRAVAYLTKTRGLDYKTVANLIKTGKLTQEARTGNAVFLIKNEHGELVGAEKVGTSTEKRYKGIASGSNPEYGFEVVKGAGEKAIFFESAIDMLSFEQIYGAELNNHRLVSMAGVKPALIEAMIQREGISPENITLCSDNDKAGNEFADKLTAKYPQMRRLTPAEGCKDWNEQLKSEHKPKKEAVKAQENSPMANRKDGERNTIVINAFGGAGAGKSTAAFHIVSELKKRGYIVELAPEYAKELVLDGNFEALNGTVESQQNIYSEQKRRIDRCIGKVDFVVTDCPIILAGMYLNDCPEKEAFQSAILAEFNKYNNFSFVVQRDAEVFESENRLGTLEEAKQMDASINKYLADNGVYFGTYVHSHIDKVINNAIATLEKSNAALEKANAEKENTPPELTENSETVENDSELTTHIHIGRTVEMVNGELKSTPRVSVSELPYEQQLQYLVDTEISINKSISDETIADLKKDGFTVDKTGKVIPLEVKPQSAEIDHKTVPIIMCNATTARDNGQIDLWRQSAHENRDCAKAIVAAIKNNSEVVQYGQSVDCKAAIDTVLQTYPAERVALVLAHEVIPTARQLAHPNTIDGRYSNDVQKWAADVISKYPDFSFENLDYCVIRDKTHPTIVGSVIKDFMTAEREIGLNKKEKPSVMKQLDTISGELKKNETLTQKKEKTNQQEI